MSALAERMAAWWASGGMLMPVMLAVSLVLYGLIGARLAALFGASAQPLPACAVAMGDERRRDRALRCALAVDQERLGRGLSLIAALTASLPLLGLLGTVTGMVDTFAALADRSGGAALRAAGGGIGLALTTTQYGLVLAVPALPWLWLLRRRAEQLLDARVGALTQAGAPS